MGLQNNRKGLKRCRSCVNLMQLEKISLDNFRFRSYSDGENKKTKSIEYDSIHFEPIYVDVWNPEPNVVSLVQSMKKNTLEEV